MNFRSFVGILCCLMIVAWAGTRVAAVRSENILLLELEHRFNRAVQQRDAHTLDSLIAPDYLLVTTGHAVLSKTEFLARVARSEPIFELSEADDVTVRIHGDTAITTGTLRQRYWRENCSIEERDRFSHTWVRSGHDWLLLSSHSGPVAPETEER